MDGPHLCLRWEVGKGARLGRLDIRRCRAGRRPDNAALEANIGPLEAATVDTLEVATEPLVAGLDGVVRPTDRREIVPAPTMSGRSAPRAARGRRGLRRNERLVVELRHELGCERAAGRNLGTGDMLRGAVVILVVARGVSPSPRSERGSAPWSEGANHNVATSGGA